MLPVRACLPHLPFHRVSQKRRGGRQGGPPPGRGRVSCAGQAVAESLCAPCAHGKLKLPHRMSTEKGGGPRREPAPSARTPLTRTFGIVSCTPQRTLAQRPFLVQRSGE